ncbi:DUF2515 family protein [Fictibacillus sp. Mic-4]|uniref:DUF2515 family protein n=1 Tax=Fictibacillus sp. Mic-4 TaxID=3132826 RepID=UPI003CF49CE9
MKELTNEERCLLQWIMEETEKGNVDNISRTVFYEKFYKRHREIKWSFLAAMVSRNAGYNMCDLKGEWVGRVLSEKTRSWLFYTYERANWLIFSDAYPQLLLYEQSKSTGKPLFHLLPYLNVSRFMKREWEVFWMVKDEERLWTSLIINEQHVIQKPVIEHPFLKRKVFRSLPFKMQEWFHFSTVLFPTRNGEIYGLSVNGFRSVENRILLGRRLGWLLFQSKWKDDFLDFASHTDHTGSRFDYEKYIYPWKRKDTPFLRMAYPIIKHGRGKLPDWSLKKKKLGQFYKPISLPEQVLLTDWYEKKQKQMQVGILLEELFM